MENLANLLSAQELEELLGKKYFYRQSIYRLAEDGKISAFQVNGILYFSSEEVVMAALRKLAYRIKSRYPEISKRLRVKFDESQEKVLTVYGFPKDTKIIANTEEETEEDLLNKLEKLREEVKNMPDLPVMPPDQGHEPPPPPPHHGPPPPPHHREMMDILRRIEERLRKIEERLG